MTERYSDIFTEPKCDCRLGRLQHLGTMPLSKRNLTLSVPLICGLPTRRRTQ